MNQRETNRLIAKLEWHRALWTAWVRSGRDAFGTDAVNATVINGYLEIDRLVDTDGATPEIAEPSADERDDGEDVRVIA
jgi:hypothetical protein